MSDAVVIALAAPLPAAQIERLRALEPRVQLRDGRGVVPPPRFEGDRLGADDPD